MCVTDCCPHSYSYRMILITISFSYRSFLHLACCTCIYYWTCPHLWYHQESESKWLSSLLFAHRKNWYPYCHLLVGTVCCLKPAYRVRTHTVNLFSFICCFHLYVVLVFTVELVRIFVTINRATSGSLHCCLLLEKSVSMSSCSSIEGQVSFIIVVCRWKNWYPYRHSLVGTTVRCLKPD